MSGCKHGRVTGSGGSTSWGRAAQANGVSPTITQAAGGITLVSNADQSDDGARNWSRDRAALFETGTNAGDYQLSSVELDMLVGNPSGTQPSYTDKLYSSKPIGDNRVPDTALVTVTNPTRLRTGLNSFTADGGFLLDSDTWYAVVLSVSDDSSANINARLRLTNAIYQEGEEGWRIGNGLWSKLRSGTNWDYDAAWIPQLVVKALHRRDAARVPARSDQLPPP